MSAFFSDWLLAFTITILWASSKMSMASSRSEAAQLNLITKPDPQRVENLHAFVVRIFRNHLLELLFDSWDVAFVFRFKEVLFVVLGEFRCCDKKNENRYGDVFFIMLSWFEWGHSQFFICNMEIQHYEPIVWSAGTMRF